MSQVSKGFTPITDSQVRSTPSPRAAVPRDIRTPIDSAADTSASIAHDVPGHHPEGGIKAATDSLRHLPPEGERGHSGTVRTLTDSDIGSPSGKPPSTAK
jgi:hypothetical protein